MSIPHIIKAFYQRDENFVNHFFKNKRIILDVVILMNDKISK